MFVHARDRLILGEKFSVIGKPRAIRSRGRFGGVLAAAAALSYCFITRDVWKLDKAARKEVTCERPPHSAVVNFSPSTILHSREDSEFLHISRAKPTQRITFYNK